MTNIKKYTTYFKGELRRVTCKSFYPTLYSNLRKKWTIENEESGSKYEVNNSFVMKKTNTNTIVRNYRRILHVCTLLCIFFIEYKFVLVINFLFQHCTYFFLDRRVSSNGSQWSSPSFIILPVHYSDLQVRSLSCSVFLR